MAEVIPHPSSPVTPDAVLAVAAQHAPAMRECVVLWSDADGIVHISWSQQRTADLAAFALSLSSRVGRMLDGGA